MDPPAVILVTEIRYLTFGRRPLAVKLTVELPQLHNENESRSLRKEMLYGEQLTWVGVVHESSMVVKLSAVTCATV